MGKGNSIAIKVNDQDLEGTLIPIHAPGELEVKVDVSIF
jgi:hypothetical protein